MPLFNPQTPFKEIVTTTFPFYVDPTGTTGNDGLTPGTAVPTVQEVFTDLFPKYEFRTPGQTLQIRLLDSAAHTFSTSETKVVVFGDIGTIQIISDSENASNVTITSWSGNFTGSGQSQRFRIDDISINARPRFFNMNIDIRDSVLRNDGFFNGNSDVLISGCSYNFSGGNEQRLAFVGGSFLEYFNLTFSGTVTVSQEFITANDNSTIRVAGTTTNPGNLTGNSLRLARGCNFTEDSAQLPGNGTIIADGSCTIEGKSVRGPFSSDAAAGAAGVVAGELIESDGGGSAPFDQAGIVLVKQ